MRDSVVFYRSFYEAIKDLPPDQFKESVKAIMEYGLDGVEPNTTGIEKTIYLLTKPQIDANNRRYENGKKGGRPAKYTEKEMSERSCHNHMHREDNQKEPRDNLEITESKPKEKDKEKDKVNVKDNKKTYACAFETLWSVYPRKKEKAAAYKCYKARLNDGFPEDELEKAVKRYAEECRANGTEDRYIKLASTFLGPNTPFTDYLGEGYKPPAKSQVKTNKFADYPHRDYDFDAIKKSQFEQ